MERTGAGRVVILGGGMAGLATAWELSTGAWRERLDSITVYQRGWRLGGKGASSRGPNSRIEEHGLHVLLGYYHETFAMMQACYAELDRPRTNPGAPILDWADAVKPSGDVSLAERVAGGWEPWSMHFTITDAMPGTPPGGRRPGDGGGGIANLGVADVVRRSFQLLVDFHQSTTLAAAAPGSTGGIVLSASSERPSPIDHSPGPLAAGLPLRAIGLTALAGACELLDQLGDATASIDARDGLVGAIQESLRAAQSALTASYRDETEMRRMRTLVDLVFTNLRGMISDGLLTDDRGLQAIDDLDYREWLAGHGASQATLDSGLVRGMYDLVFAYRHGSESQPAFAAGLGLDLATRMLLDYHGAIFWKMQAGMGEVIFAPLYEALRERGVEFRFFHELDDIQLSDDGTRVESIHIRQQAGVAVEGYDPLIEAGGLPAWPNRPRYEQLDPICRDALDTSESISHVPISSDALTLAAGKDFDVAVLAVSLGIIPSVCGDLVRTNPRWQAMVDNVGTVATQALQLWMTSTDAELGWSGPSGTTLSGFRQPFDTWASMAHLIEREDWREDQRPATIAYFCSALDESTSLDGNADIAAADIPAEDLVRAQALDFMNGDLRHLWPAAVGDDGFDLTRLTPVGQGLDGQYWRANDDPSDRYVQSLPGTDRYRLRADQSGYPNLVLAGDWTDCGLNAGCIEAATLSGLRAAEAVQKVVS